MTLEVCKACGNAHDSLSGSIPVSLPTEAAQIPEIQRAERVWSTSELCVVDDESFYLYGSIEIKIQNHPEGFSWGAWARLSEDRFFWYQDLLAVEGREENSSFEGVLGTDIPFYPPTIGLPLSVHIQPKGLRPLFLLKHGTHPLVHDQEVGISVERIKAIKSWFRSLSQPIA